MRILVLAEQPDCFVKFRVQSGSEVRALVQPNRHNCRDTYRNHPHRQAKFPKAYPEASSVRLPRVIPGLSLLVFDLGLNKRVSGFCGLAGKSVRNDALEKKESRQVNAAQPSSETEFETAACVRNKRLSVHSAFRLEYLSLQHLTCPRKPHPIKLLYGRKAGTCLPEETKNAIFKQKAAKVPKEFDLAPDPIFSPAPTPQKSA
jgi:hypothetical protein